MGELSTLVFGGLARLAEWLAGRDPWWTLAIVAGCLFVAYVVAWLLQELLIRRLRARPWQHAPLGRLEASFSVLAPLALVYFLFERIARAIYAWLRRSRGRDGDAEERGSGRAEGIPVRVATLGPSFFLAGLLCGVAYWLSQLSGPLLARSFGVNPGHSFWEYLLIGQRAELGWLLPLDHRPRLALVLTLLFWLAAWWSLGNLLRGLVLRSGLQRNLADTDETTLPSWYSSFGVRAHTEPSRSYRAWVAWMVTAVIVLLAAAGASLGREDGGVAPATLSVALVLTLSWVLHLRLRGFSSRRDRPASEAEEETSAGPLPGWPKVVQELERLHGLEAPSAQGRRPITSLRLSRPAAELRTLSPLAGELLSGSGTQVEPQAAPGLTAMQWKVLNSLALSGFVHLDPPQQGGELTLRAGGPERTEDRSGLSERHQIVLAPEGSGKTTLAILAAANHTLVHSRATLIVTRSEAQAQETFDRIVAAVEPSTVRWNLRRRRVGRDFASDLSRDIIPDVVVCSFHELVTNLLDNSEAFAPFLRNVGLVVVDDVESFTGGVEIHAQLGFRRLSRLFRQLAGVEQLGEENAPLWLCLGVDTMKDTSAWVKSLCGIQAAVRSFPVVPTPGPDAGAEEAGPGDGEASGDGEVDGDRPLAEPAAEQKLYYFHDLFTSSGRPLTEAEVVAACEAQGVPWHYRPCGDGRRFRRHGVLLLEKEPEYVCDSPAQACVLLLEGRWSEVRRELGRLPWAGCESGRSEVTLLAVVDPDETVACEALVPGFRFDPGRDPSLLSELGEELASLPLPIVRTPSSTVVQAHLLADLLQHWIEVEELVGTFESTVTASLRQLRQQGMLRTEERSDVRPETREHQPRVYVRALAGSVAANEEASPEEGIKEFAPFDKVRQVELVSRRAVTVRNRVDHTRLRQVEVDSAGLVYYPGRVFEDSGGRYVVVGRTGIPSLPGAVEAEPALYDHVSSPRRRCRRIEETDRGWDGSPLPYSLLDPELVLLGRDPVAIGLVKIKATIEPVATYRLDRSTGEVRSRELHAPTIRELFETPLATVALILQPNPEKSPAGAPALRFAEARLLAALFRFVLPLVYRDVREHVEVALHVEGAAGDGGSATGESPGPDVPLGAGDGLYFLDLHREGNGTAQALYREGLELPLRLCRHVLEQITDLRRLMRLYDHWGDRDEVVAEGRMEEEAPSEEPGGEVADARPGPPKGEQGGPSVRTESEVDSGQNDEGTEFAAEQATATELHAEEPVEREGAEPDEPKPPPAEEDTKDPNRWSRARQGLLEWLDSRLHPEPVPQAPEEETPTDEGEAA